MNDADDEIDIREPYQPLADAVNKFIERAHAASAIIPPDLLNKKTGEPLTLQEVSSKSVAELIDAMNPFMGMAKIRHYSNDNVSEKDLTRLSVHSRRYLTGDTSYAHHHARITVDRFCTAYEQIDLRVKIRNPHPLI